MGWLVKGFEAEDRLVVVDGHRRIRELFKDFHS